MLTRVGGVAAVWIGSQAGQTVVTLGNSCLDWFDASYLIIAASDNDSAIFFPILLLLTHPFTDHTVLA